MPSTDLTHALLATLAGAYPGAIHVPALAAEVDCELAALYRHLWMLHDLGAIRATAHGDVPEAASITDRGLSLLR
jgi:hypothetical protein